MSNEAFHRMIQRTCTNGPLNPAEMQHEIDLIDYSVQQHKNACVNARPCYGRSVASLATT